MYPVERQHSASAWQSEPSHKRAMKLVGRLAGHVVAAEEVAVDQTASVAEEAAAVVVAEEAAAVVAEGAADQTAAQTDLETPAKELRNRAAEQQA